ncbi:MAG: hypothetical protein Q9162_000475 [Coniocarpon cinnabarinum]
MQSPAPGKDNDLVRGRKILSRLLLDITSMITCALERPLLLEDPLLGVGGRLLRNLNQDYESLLHLANEKLHAFKFSEVPLCWVRLYEEAQLHAISALHKEPLSSTGAKTDSKSRQIELDLERMLTLVVQKLDLVLIKTQGLGRKALIHAVLSHLDLYASTHLQTPSVDLDGQHALENGLNSEDVYSEEDILTPGQSPPEDAELVKCHAARGWLSRTLSRYALPSVFPTHSHNAPKLQQPLQTLRGSSESDLMRQFCAHQSTMNSPVVISNGIGDWPATSNWTNPNYWLAQTHGGRRIVPVELGSKYTDDEWGQQILDFGTFLSQHLCGLRKERDTSYDSPETQEALPRGYLAQHEFFEQMPTFYKDIRIPDYCFVTSMIDKSLVEDKVTNAPTLKRKRSLPVDGCRLPAECHYSVKSSIAEDPLENCSNANGFKGTSAAHEEASISHGDADGVRGSSQDDSGFVGEEEEPSEIKINIWLGPADTVSPAHTDSHHNILAQVMGRKYIRLYPPSQSEYMYPMRAHEGKRRHSLSVDPLRMTDPMAGATRSNAQSGFHQEKLGDYPEQHSVEQVDMSNTSQLDVGLDVEWEREDDASRRVRLEQRERQLEGFPEAAHASFQECVLGPGDCLFIPRGWWHYVQSLDVSASVSFWWD